MIAHPSGVLPHQAATAENEESFEFDDNISDFLYQSLKSYIKSCETYDLSRLTYDFNNKRSFLLLHINISSLQTHIDELNDLLLNFTSPPSILFISETRINIKPHININIPGYVFLHFPSPTKADGVGAYVLKSLKFIENDSLRLQVRGCEDLWLEVDLPDAKCKFVFSVIYRHPCNNTNAFLEALDDNMQKLHKKRARVIIMGDINIDLSSTHHSLSQNDYLNTIKSNGFSSLITNPTRVITTSQTIIDHILTNVHDLVLTPGVFSYKFADHYPIFFKV